MSLAARLLDADGPHAPAWERLVQANPASGFMQGLGWARFRRRLGLGLRHVGLFRDDALVGGAIAYFVERPAGTMLVSPHGPVLPWHDRPLALAGMRALEAELAALPTAIGWRIEPRLAAPRPGLLRNYARAPFDLLPLETLHLDLGPAPAELLAAMRPKGRYNIGLARRRGVVVKALPPGEGLAPLYDVLQQAAARDAFFLEPRSFFALLLEELGPTGQATVLVAEREGECLGALLLLRHGFMATYLYGGVSNHERQHMAGYALQWEAIQLAKAAGCTHYDFYGFDPFNRPDHDYARFSRFKRQFGGTPRQFLGAHEHLFHDRLAGLVVEALHEIGWSS